MKQKRNQTLHTKRKGKGPNDGSLNCERVRASLNKLLTSLHDSYRWANTM